MPDHPGPTSAPTPARTGDAAERADAESFPHWFTQFLNDRQTRKPSAHTMKAYRQDFTAIASLMTHGSPARLTVADITKDSMRTAFAAYARDHEAASISRCWSTWNVLCTFLYTGGQLAANPMQLVGRPKLAKPLPKALPRPAVQALLETVADDQDSHHRTDWAERDLALILTGLRAGLRAEELRRADVGDIRSTDDGAAVIHVKGKGGFDQSVFGRAVKESSSSWAGRGPHENVAHRHSDCVDLVRCELAGADRGVHRAKQQIGENPRVNVRTNHVVALG